MQLLLRADATPKIGTGHIMRCVALAQAAKSFGFSVHLIGRVTVPWVLKRLESEGIAFNPLADLPPEQEDPVTLLGHIAECGKPDWLVLDGYHFGLDCQQAVRNAGHKLLVIDDYAHLPEYSCDILLNQNIGAEELPYKGDIGKKLLGPKFALLRQEFIMAIQQAEKRIPPSTCRNILLTLGGGDFSNHLEQIASYFETPLLSGCTVRVIAGSMPPEHIQNCLQNCPATIEILQRVENMPAILLQTDLCITAGGSTCWELCCLGVPFLTVVVAENQKGICKQLDIQDIASFLSHKTLSHCLNDVTTRFGQRMAGLSLVAPAGSEFVCVALLNTGKS